MAVPKRKTSKARRDKRKSANMKMTAPGLYVHNVMNLSFLIEFAQIATTMTARKL